MERKAYKHDSKAKENLIGDLKGLLRDREEIAFAYLFGSFLEEEPFHDIDIGVYLSESSPQQHPSYAFGLSQILSERLQLPVDVRILNSAPLSFLFHVIRGKLILERDEELSARIAEQTVRKYLDMKPLIYRGIKEAFGG